jgi:hypothetical protein
MKTCMTGTRKENCRPISLINMDIKLIKIKNASIN